MPFGIRGQLKLFAITSRPEHLNRVKTVFVGDDFKPYKVQRAAVHKASVVILTLEDITSREDADTLRGQEVYIRESDALPLAEGEYYLHDLPGLRVQMVDGTELGVVKQVLETGANEVLVVERSEGGEALIPMIKDVIKDLNIAEGTVTIEPLPGLLE